ncbi:hypothetical protein ACIGBH_39630 [Streptomyces sp. NPDC085929]|uniref:hypothetical protein n=1 Tax=Streptomyces sp. NPDC085929 TaxID=3365739 RepID=UPI0037D0C379
MWIRKALKWVIKGVLPLENPPETIYGSVVTGAVLASASEPPVNLSEVVFSVIASLLIYWFAHVYAEEFARSHPGEKSFSWSRLLRSARVQWALVKSSFIPVLALLLVALFGGGANLAIEVGLWSVVLILLCWGLVTAHRKGMKGTRLVLAGLLAAALGVAIVMLKSVVVDPV